MDMLYHYTSQAGIVGICSSKTLWASKIQFLNDHQEFKIGLKLAKDALKSASDTVDHFFGRICLAAIERVESVENINVFVASFSERSDLLSQWRAYSKGSLGFAVGFSKARLAALESEGFRLRKCIYDPDMQERVFQQVITNCLNFPWKLPKEGYDYGIHLDAVTSRVLEEVISHAPLMKHRGFSEEQEWRLISLPKSYGCGHCDARPGGDGLIPYYKIPLGSAALPLVFEEIWVGPTHNFNRASDGLVALLASHNCDARGIRPSKIPYRNT